MRSFLEVSLGKGRRIECTVYGPVLRRVVITRLMWDSATHICLPDLNPLSKVYLSTRLDYCSRFDFVGAASDDPQFFL